MLQSRIRFLLVCSLVVFFGFPGAAKNLYVRKGASGSNNGSDWNNAWTDVTQISWGGVNPGDSIWIAGGNYGTLLIGASGATNNPIYMTGSVPRIPSRPAPRDGTPPTIPRWFSVFTTITAVIAGSRWTARCLTAGFSSPTRVWPVFI